MKVKDLIKLLNGVDGEMDVLIPISQEFDGMFYSPCKEESGVSSLATEDLSEEDIAEMELLGKPLPEKDSFILVPCAFFEEKSHIHELN